ncbi:MAG: hypothetical protein HY709_10590 [Candidatus Latescibacteria bacterium]|nr:hypothetical protein [Candidatus Latescibacterota bacterium]
MRKEQKGMIRLFTQQRLFMIIITGCLMIAGCGAYGDSDNYTPTGPGNNGNTGGTGDQPIVNPSYKDHIQPIFTANCALSGCHAGSRPEEGMSLEEGKSHGNIVNQPSRQVPSRMRIKPSDPDNSYLYRKIQGEQGAVGGSGSRMPKDRSSLSSAQIETIKNWITQGAQDN